MPEEVAEERQSVNSEAMECLLGGVVLPVPPASMRIRQALKIDEIEIKGRSGKVKRYASYCSLMIVSDTTFGNRRRAASLRPWHLDGASSPGGSYK